MLSAMLQLMLRWLKASLAEPKTTISSGLSSTAASKPLRLGVSTEYATPLWRVIPAITSWLSAICGTHLGLT
ncbi:hypothetical protein D3C71_1310770 [compost metagenome]